MQEALKLLKADNDRTPYEAGLDTFVVSPVNARKQLLALIHRAKKELLVYDPKIADTEMLRALSDAGQAGRGRQGHRVDRPTEPASEGSAARRLPAAYTHDRVRPA